MSTAFGSVERIVVSDAGFLPTTRQMALALNDSLSEYLTPYWPGRWASRPSTRSRYRQGACTPISGA